MVRTSHEHAMLKNFKPSKEKTLIGVLASRDSKEHSRRLASLVVQAIKGSKDTQPIDYHFVFTGGTFRRIFHGDRSLADRGLGHPGPVIDPMTAAEILKSGRISVLPDSSQGGLIKLTYLITEGQCSVVWPLYAPTENHWLRPENFAFMRLCDHWHVKRLMNEASILNWIVMESQLDADRNPQPCSRHVKLVVHHPDAPKNRKKHVEILSIPQAGKDSLQGEPPMGLWHWSKKNPKPIGKMTLALISHDRMKSRMVEFVIDHEHELSKFGWILATGTTGREVADAARSLKNKVLRCHSGPKGGDIEIATEILTGRCDVVIFFVDPLRPHPHIDDIRVVFQACMTNQKTVMITHEMHAREFMTRVVRKSKPFLWEFEGKEQRPSR